MIFYSPNSLTMQDYPGKLAIMIFTKGCNLRCPICHNALLALGKVEGLRAVTTEDVLKVVKVQEGWIDGVCISGGEPTIHLELNEALRAFKKAGLAVKVDTNGTWTGHLMEMIFEGLIDYVAMDVKSPLEPEIMRIVTGTDGHLLNIRNSIANLKGTDIEVEFRTVVIPDLVGPEEVGKIAKEIAPCDKYTLLPFDPSKPTLDPRAQEWAAPMDAFMAQCHEAASEFLDSKNISPHPAPRPNEGGGHRK